MTSIVTVVWIAGVSFAIGLWCGARLEERNWRICRGGRLYKVIHSKDWQP